MIFDLGQTNILKAFDLGVELGYFFQFGIFSYIMIGIMNQSVRQPFDPIDETFRVNKE